MSIRAFLASGLVWLTACQSLDNLSGGADAPDAGGAPEASACSADLTRDAKHCGRCGHDCVGGACQSGVCQPVVVATGQASPEAIAVDRATGSVYWTNIGDATVVELVLGVGPRTVASNQRGPRGIAIVSGRPVWTSVDSGEISTLRGGAVALVASGQSAPYDVAGDDAATFWVNRGGEVMRLDPTVPSPAVVASGQDQPTAIALDAQSVYWVASGSPTGAGGSVVKAPRGGGASTTLASGVRNPRGIAVSGEHVYFTSYGGGATGPAVVRVPIAGGPQEVIASGQLKPLAVAVDASRVYWVNEHAGGALFAAPLAGGAPTPLATGLAAPHAIALDDVSVYVAVYDAGTVLRVAKP
jgi:sugar lactone lactonase YvrE